MACIKFMVAFQVNCPLFYCNIRNFCFLNFAFFFSWISKIFICKMQPCLMVNQCRQGILSTGRISNWKGEKSSSRPIIALIVSILPQNQIIKRPNDFNKFPGWIIRHEFIYIVLAIKINQCQYWPNMGILL